MASRYREQGLSVVGIHTPEFDSERVRANVEEAVRRERLDFPQLLDNDYAYWNALGNQYWPAIYLVDRCGRIRAKAIGEVHANEQSSRKLEDQIKALLQESLSACSGAD